MKFPAELRFVAFHPAYRRVHIFVKGLVIDDLFTDSDDEEIEVGREFPGHLDMVRVRKKDLTNVTFVGIHTPMPDEEHLMP